MCLIINELKKYEAQKDILVFKIVIQKGRHDDVVKSADKNFKYERGYHYYETGHEDGFRIYTVDHRVYGVYEGLHAYTSLKKAESAMKLYKSHIKNDQKPVIVKMLIPAGAKYYINKKDKEVVANEIIYPPKQWRITAQTL